MSAPHFLVVAPFDPDDETGRFDVEHPADCPKEEFDGGDFGEPNWRHNCAVEFHLDNEGIGEYFRHADDPEPPEPWSHAEPVPVGRHEIEAWSHRHPAGPWGLEEWDGGLRLVDEDGQS